MTTLQEHVDRGDHIMVYCENLACNHAWPLNFALAIEKLGQGFDIVNDRDRFLSRLICAKCGARYPSLRLSNDAARDAGRQAAATWGMIPARAGEQ